MYGGTNIANKPPAVLMGTLVLGRDEGATEKEFEFRVVHIFQAGTRWFLINGYWEEDQVDNYRKGLNELMVLLHAIQDKV